MIILNSNSGGQLGRPAARPAAHRSHANTPYSWRIPASRQGFNVLFCFIHEGRSFHLFQRVFGAFGGCLPVLAGVGGCWRALVTPHVLYVQTCQSVCECVCVCVCVSVSVCVCVCVCVCVRGVGRGGGRGLGFSGRVLGCEGGR